MDIDKLIRDLFEGLGVVNQDVYAWAKSYIESHGWTAETLPVDQFLAAFAAEWGSLAKSKLQAAGPALFAFFTTGSGPVADAPDRSALA